MVKLGAAAPIDLLDIRPEEVALFELRYECSCPRGCPAIMLVSFRPLEMKRWNIQMDRLKRASPHSLVNSILIHAAAVADEPELVDPGSVYHELLRHGEEADEVEGVEEVEEAEGVEEVEVDFSDDPAEGSTSSEVVRLDAITEAGVLLHGSKRDQPGDWDDGVLLRLCQEVAATAALNEGEEKQNLMRCYSGLLDDLSEQKACFGAIISQAFRWGDIFLLLLPTSCVFLNLDGVIKIAPFLKFFLTMFANLTSY